VTRYQEVVDALLGKYGRLSRVVPYGVLPEDARHCTLDASWGLDGEEHRESRGSLSHINAGSTPAAREFTRWLTATLLRQLMQEPPPWDLARVVYEVSMHLIVQHTLQAPVLLPYVRRLRELTRNHVAAEGGFFGIQRDLEAEAILGTVKADYPNLPQGSLARHLVERYQNNPRRLLGQLWLLIVSAETQATQALNTLGMLLESNKYQYARTCLGKPIALNLLMTEGVRRGITFPSSLAITLEPYRLNGQTVGPGQAIELCYIAGNLDDEVYKKPLVFNPKRPLGKKPLTYGFGGHRCLGERPANEFLWDVVTTALRVLPYRMRLHTGYLLRETGISMSVAQMLVAPSHT
jgi:hypothetical protein